MTKSQDSWKFFDKTINVNGEEIDVYFVDAPYIRSNIDVKFELGGHDYVYDFIPKGEIWLEKTSRIEDTMANFFHEVLERSLMKYKKMDYEKAHNIAEKNEEKFRKEHE